ncbi:hypothetical protein Bbelb_092500 [Branchiostoma belcheri]|nr:hypothetical protein Bbelb_092500 [Branchiostoma belcheri]
MPGELVCWREQFAASELSQIVEVDNKLEIICRENHPPVQHPCSQGFRSEGRKPAQKRPFLVKTSGLQDQAKNGLLSQVEISVRRAQGVRDRSCMLAERGWLQYLCESQEDVTDKPDTPDKATEDQANSLTTSDGMSSNNNVEEDMEQQKDSVEAKADRTPNENNDDIHQCKDSKEKSKLDKMEEFTDTAAYWIVCTNWP